MKRIMFFFALLLFTGLGAIAQSTVTGTVTGADDGESLPGVNVSVKGTTIGTMTNMDGKYSIEVPDGSTTLVFSFVGMNTQEVEISGTIVNCALEVGDSEIGEVIITALGISKEEKTLGYSATSIGADEFEKNSNVDAMNSLQGKVAGVSVTSGGGAPGASTKVIIRGYSSVSGNNNPLYVVDGVPINNASRTNSTSGIDFGNRGNDINPNDIASMTILKGAAATAQYGPRGANGVIMITTKQGKKQNGLSVEYNGSISTFDVLRTPQMQNTFGEGWSGHWADDENGSWGPKMDGKLRAFGNVVNGAQQLKKFSPVKKNLYDFYEFGKQYNNSVSLSGGDDKSTFYVSFTNQNSNGIIPTDVDKNVKNAIKFSGTRKGKILTTSVNVNYVRRDGTLLADGRGGTSAAANLYSELLQIPRDFSIVDFKDYKGNDFNNLDNYYTPYAFNPYYALNENQTSFFENRIYGSITLDFKLTDWLHLSYRPGIDASSFSRKDWESVMLFTPGSYQDNKSTATSPGMVYEESRNTTEFNQDYILAGSKNFGDFSVDGMLGFNSYSTDYKRVSGQINTLVIPFFYNLTNTDGVKETSTYQSQKRTYAYYGSAGLGYKNFAFLNFTGRKDYSSTLPKDANSFFYPAVNTSIIVSDIVPAVKSFADLIKVRASWGKAGNDADPYLLDPTFAGAQVWVPYSTLKFPLNGVGAFEKSNIIGNPKLKPEITTEKEVGVDLRFFKSRLSLDFAYYDRVSSGQILRMDIAPSSGFAQQVINFGDVENKGIELLATIVPVKTKNFKWEATVNFTKNTNKVLSLGANASTEIVLASAYDTEMVAMVGKPLGVLRAPDYKRDAAGHIIVSPSTGIPEGTTEKTEIGTIQPDYILGFSNSLNFKGFDLSFTIDYRPGGYFYSGTADLQYFVGNATKTQYNERQPFIVPNSVKPNPYFGSASDPYGTEYIENDVPIAMTNINAYYYHSSNTVANRARVLHRDLLKLRDISLAYTLPSSITKMAKLQSIQFVLSGRNLLLFTPKDNNFVDPEATSFGNDLRGAFGEFRTGPTLRSFTGSIRIKF